MCGGSEREYPVYELITNLVPKLHEAHRASTATSQDDTTPFTVPSQAQDASPERMYHALLSSHHLISPTKRRNMQSWSSQLSVTGFAKVGYPGVIYCEGLQTNVEEFVANVKAMQWLALRLRFLEPLPVVEAETGWKDSRRWMEFEKVGEVVQEMKRLGRDSYVVEMGIGSAGT